MDDEKLIEILKQDRTDLYADLETKSEEFKAAYSEINQLKDRIAKLTGENEAYKAMMDTYQRIHANDVSDMCPYCGNGFTMEWNTAADGNVLQCPHCGKHVVLCDGDNEGSDDCFFCFYDSDLGCCKYQKGE